MADVLDDAEIDQIPGIIAHPDDVDFGAAGRSRGGRTRGSR